MEKDLSIFIRDFAEVYKMTVGETVVEIDALFSMNRMEEYLTFIDAGVDYRTAVAKLAYSMYKGIGPNENALKEADFHAIAEEELERFAVVLYKQVIDPERALEAEVSESASIYEKIYIESNRLRLQMAETARKLIAPFMKSQKRIAELHESFSAASKIENLIPKFGISCISNAFNHTNYMANQRSIFYTAAHDLGAISTAFSQSFGLRNIIEPTHFTAMGNTLNQFVNTMISPDVVSALQQTASQVEAIVSPLRNVLSSISEKFFSPLQELWATIDFDEIHQSFLEKERKGIEQMLYDTKWFMFSAEIAVGNFVLDVVEIMQNKRIKNHSKHINAVVYKYVTQDSIDEIKRDWKSRQISKHIKRILCEALDAYKHKRYASTTIILSNMWQGMVADLSGYDDYRTHNKTKEQFAQILKEGNASQVVIQFFNEYIWKDCHSPEDVIDDIPGRNAIAHGWLMKAKYPSRKTALNAILFTHFLMDNYAYEDE